MDITSLYQVAAQADFGCGYCGYPVERWYVYCAHCVARLRWDQPTLPNRFIPGTCPECESPIGPAFRFCTQCGKEVTPQEHEALQEQWQARQLIHPAWIQPAQGRPARPVDPDLAAAKARAPELRTQLGYPSAAGTADAPADQADPPE